MNREEILCFYKKQLEDNFFPYWAVHEDRQWGGILNCLNNTGDQVMSTNKFTWSQGRWLWILGKLYELKKAGVLTQLDQTHLEGWMEHTWNFITSHSLYDDSRCCFLLERDGTKIADSATGRYDTSIYADCFALIGMAQYIKVMKQQERFTVVQDLYKSIVKRIETGDYLTEPYPVPCGYTVHGIPMILVNTVWEYCQMKRELGLPFESEFCYALEKAHFILNEMYDPSGLIREHKFLGKRDGSRDEFMIDRHINPGHTLEDLWFIAEILEAAGEIDLYLEKICKIAENTFELGWDQEYGGLLRFVDLDGGKPKGKLLSDVPEPYEALIMDTWDMKLWWPHSEILYLFLLLYEKSGKEKMDELYKKSAEYVFRTFPSEKNGEWVQIRSRNGLPEEKVVALPVKDPFHIMRNYIKIVELYSLR